MRGRDEPGSAEQSPWTRADPPIAERPTATATAPSAGWVATPDAVEPAAPAENTTEWLPAGFAGRSRSAHAAVRSAPVDPELEARRRQAVSAFFTEAGVRATALRFSAEALDIFESRSAAGEIDGSDESLLGVTGELAAQRKLLVPPRSGWRGAVARALSEEGACSSTGALLAKRAGGTIGESDRRELEAHLADCLTCRAVEVRWARAERAFRATLQFGAAAATARESARGAGVGAAAGGTGAGAAAAGGAAAVGAVALGAAGAGAAEAASPVAATSPPLVEPTAAAFPGYEPPRRRRLTGIPLVAAIVLALAGIAAAAVVVLGGGSSSQHPVQAASPAAKSSQPAAGKHITPARHARKHTATVHHRPRPAHKPKAAASPTVTAAAPSTSSSTPVTPVTAAPTPTPTPTPAPVTPAPAPAASSGSGSGSSSPSVSIQQPSLGASNAPTQTISPKH